MAYTQKAAALLLLSAVLCTSPLSGCAPASNRSGTEPHSTVSVSARPTQPTSSDPYFAMFLTLISKAPMENTTMMAVDTSRFEIASPQAFVELLQNYCQQRNIQLYMASMEELEEKGYLQNGEFTNGYLLQIYNAKHNTDVASASVCIWRSQNEKYRDEYRATQSNSLWNVESL